MPLLAPPALHDLRPLDLEIDAELLWPMFQKEISDALVVEVQDVTKDKGLVHDLRHSSP